MESTIIEILKEFMMEDMVIDESTTIEDLNIDSFQFIQFIVEIEAKFNIEIADEKLDMSEYLNFFELIKSIDSLIAEAKNLPEAKELS